MPTSKAKKKQSAGKKTTDGRGGRKSTNGSGRKGTRAAASKRAQRGGGKTSKKSATPGATVQSRPPVVDKRQLVQERKILRSQSRWLQKALFALDRAEDDHAKLAEVRGDSHEPMAVTIAGTTHKVGTVTDSLRESVMDRLEGLRHTLREEHALMG